MSVDKPRLLLIEDEPEIRRFLRVSLVGHGFDLTECQTGREGLLRAAEAPPDIVLLDLGLPDIDGLQFIQELRGWSAVPIVVLSARGAEHDKIQALDAGADDYLTKPFGVGELLARVRVALRHARQGTEPGEPTVTSGPLRIDLAARQVTLDGHEVRLTPTEYRLLALLARHAGKVVTHRQLLKDVWGPEAVHETHYLRVYLAQLRQKLDDVPAQPRFLLTEPGVGYRLIGE
jgi:two-component system KDP operon response regulator KdpE